MTSRDLGNKHVCFKCGTRFYDLKKPMPVCPKCHVDQREAPPEAKAPRRPARPDPVEEEAPEVEEESAEETDEDEDDE